MLGMGEVLMAKGTLAGTSVTNQALIEFAVGGVDGNLTSNSDLFKIDRVVNTQIAWQDTAPVEVGAGDHDRVLTFILTNLGNGEDNITLSYEHNTTSNFLPQGVQIFRDDNNNSHYDPGVDTLISSAVTLGADANTTLFLVGNIPDNNTTTPGAQSHDGIHAASESNATAGADRQDQVDIVILKKDDNATGAWVIRDYWLVTEKNATVHSDDNATHTGTRVTYTIDCHIGGHAAGRQIEHVVVTDRVPAGTRYLPGTLKLGSVALSDAGGDDAGEYVDPSVIVRIGTLSGAGHKKIHFDVEVE
jgi:uncharacterized repeat protein (TIGR01451 family)